MTGTMSSTAESAEEHDAPVNRHHFGYRHPVDAVHEIGEIDEPYPAEEEGRALEPPRNRRHHVPFAGKYGDHRGRRNALDGEPGAAGKVRISSTAPTSASRAAATVVAGAGRSGSR